MEPEVLYDKLSHMKVPEIVSFCEQHRIIGIPQESHECALAKLFHATTSIEGVSVGNNITVWKECGRYAEATEFELTPEMYSFIEQFDREEFPSISHITSCSEMCECEECIEE